MHIAVCIKQVAARNTPLFINGEAQWIDESQASFETSEADVTALEEALRLKDTLGARVSVITLGAQHSAQVLTQALAKGADQAIHIEDENWFQRSPFELASALAASLDNLECDLILTGLQSDDHGYAQTGIMIAEILAYPHISMVVDIQLNDNVLKAKKEMQAGLFQNVELTLPAVLTLQSGINKPRYANMKDILQAKKKKTLHTKISELIDKKQLSTQAIHRLCAPDKTKQTLWIEDNAENSADILLKKLKWID